MWYAEQMHKVEDYGLLRIAGENAATFLQGQLSCDVLNLSADESQFGAYCNYQGRVLATFWLLQHDAVYDLILPEEMLDATREALHKYAVFSKVTIENVTEDISIKAKVSDTIQFQVVNKSEQAGGNHFSSQLIDAGIPMIYPATSGHFTPHMLNLPALGAVSFDKGCYVGQEIVARTEYRGAVKRCLQIIHDDEKRKLTLGDKTPDENGEVVNFYYPKQGGTVYLAVVKI